MAENSDGTGKGTGKHPGSENLRPPFEPGQTGNPGGSSKKQRDKKDFRDWLDKNMPDRAAEVYKHLADKATSRDFRYLAEFLNRYGGKVPSKNEISGPEGGPLDLNIQVMDPKMAAQIEEIKKKLAG